MYPDDRLLPLALNAATGEARTVREGVLYKIPVAKRAPAGVPKWEPLVEK